MSAKRIAASTPSLSTGSTVTSAATSGVRHSSRNPIRSRIARYSGRKRPAWRMSHTGVKAVERRRHAARNGCTAGTGLPPSGRTARRLGNAVGFGRQRHDSIALVGHDRGSPNPPSSSPLTSDAGRARQVALADLAAAIERAAADLALAEEPSGFVAALESGAPPPPAPAEPPRG